MLILMLIVLCGKITGSFPDFVSSLTNLYFLGLGENFYNPSTLSSSLQMLKKVQALLLYGSSLSGTIPSELSSLTSLTIFRIDDNNLVGEWYVMSCMLVVLNDGSTYIILYRSVYFR